MLTPLLIFLSTVAEIRVMPSRFNVTSDSFTVKFTIHNLGKAINDSLPVKSPEHFQIKASQQYFRQRLPRLSKDSMLIKLPIVGNRDKGRTTIAVTVNENRALDESDSTNNTASVIVNITSADLLPIAPYNYSIVNVWN